MNTIFSHAAFEARRTFKAQDKLGPSKTIVELAKKLWPEEEAKLKLCAFHEGKILREVSWALEDLERAQVLEILDTMRVHVLNQEMK